jgi:DNA-binding response OmpR family regulator
MARIILAEDDEPLRAGLTLVLESAGHQVEAVPDGSAALDALNHEMADLVVTDIRMPQMDGLELLRILREEGPRVPVIVMSGTDPTHRARLFGIAGELGAHAMLAKPFRAHVLLHAVEICLRRESAEMG